MQGNPSWMREAMALEYAAETGQNPYDVDREILDDYIIDTVSEMGVMDHVRNDDPEGWFDNLEDRMYESEAENENAFRFTEIADDVPLNCLGFVTGMATYNRQTADSMDDRFMVHYDKKFDPENNNRQRFDLPHISAEIGEFEVLDPEDEYQFNEKIERSQLADMYALGLAVKELQDPGEIQISNENMMRIADNVLKRNKQTSESDYIRRMATEMKEDFHDKKLNEDEYILVG